MNAFLMETAYFGVVLTLLGYWFATWIAGKVKSTLCNPILISAMMIIGILAAFHIEYTTYQKGAAYITYFLNPATVCLAVPLYRQYCVLKENITAVICGIFAGCLGCLVTIAGLAFVFQLSPELTASLLPKSITTAIALGLSEEIGGIASITVAAVIVTGIFGASIASAMCKILKIEEPVAQGLAIGASAHAVGTSRALELGEIQGAMSSLAIVVTGILTVLLVPAAVGFFL